MEKRIYKYNDGFSDLYADPSEIDYRMAKATEMMDMEVIGKWLTLPTDDDGNVLDDSEISAGDKANFTEACHRMLPAIRSAFDIKEFDKSTGQGMTMDELLGLWAAYLEWKADVKKNIETPPTDASPTDSTATSSPTSTGRRTIPGVRPKSVFMGSTSTPAGASPSSGPSSTKPIST